MASAREIEQLGLRVRLISPQFVKPYLKTNKNDASDAEAILRSCQPPVDAFRAGQDPSAA